MTRATGLEKAGGDVIATPQSSMAHWCDPKKPQQSAGGAAGALLT